MLCNLNLPVWNVLPTSQAKWKNYRQCDVKLYILAKYFLYIVHFIRNNNFLQTQPIESHKIYYFIDKMAGSISVYLKIIDLQFILRLNSFHFVPSENNLFIILGIMVVIHQPLLYMKCFSLAVITNNAPCFVTKLELLKLFHVWHLTYSSNV